MVQVSASIFSAFWIVHQPAVSFLAAECLSQVLWTGVLFPSHPFEKRVRKSTGQQEPTVAGQRSMEILDEKVNAQFEKRDSWSRYQKGCSVWVQAGANFFFLMDSVSIGVG